MTSLSNESTSARPNWLRPIVTWRPRAKKTRCSSTACRTILRSPLVNLQGFSKELSGSCAEIRAILDEQPLPAPIHDRCLALLDGEISESIRFIQSAVSRLSTNIDSLLRLSRVGRIELQHQAVDANPIVAKIIESMHDTISNRGARLIAAELSPLWGDPVAVEQIFANLIGNALNYLDPQRPGVIEIGSLVSTCKPNSNDPPGRPANRELNTYFVRDNGLGIPESYAKKVFQIFQRLHPTAAPGEGMGLAMHAPRHAAAGRRNLVRVGRRRWHDVLLYFAREPGNVGPCESRPARPRPRIESARTHDHSGMKSATHAHRHAG